MHDRVIIAGLLASLPLLAGCQGQPAEGVTSDTAKSFAGISESDTIYFSGNEPFWNGETSGKSLNYRTPDDIEGRTIAVKRFAGLNGLSLSGRLDDAAFDMVITDARCNDTMADRTYPFTVTLSVGGGVRQGCAWTDARPYSGDASP